MPERNYGGNIEQLTSETEQGEEFLDVGKFLSQVGSEELDLPPALDTSHLKPAQKAEIMWSIYRELQRELWRSPKQELSVVSVEQKELRKLAKEDKDGEEGFNEEDLSTKIQSKKQKIESDNTLKMKLSILSSLWQDEKTRSLFQKEYNRHIKEDREMNGEHEKYKKLTIEMKKLERQIDELTTEMFKNRGKKEDELSTLLYDNYFRSLEQKKRELENLLIEKPELSALAGYEELVEFQRQMQTEHFVWTDSRKDIYKQLSEKMLSGRPVMILSESGAGKTSIVSAAAKRLTGENVSRVVGGQHARAERLFATRELGEDQSYYKYQPIMEALSGKSSEKDKKPKHQGRICLDDEFNNRPQDTQMEIIKNLSGNIIPGKDFQVPNTTNHETVQPNFSFVACGNPASDRYVRKDTDVAVEREFGGNVVEMDYLEQTKDNPELFQVLLVSLMDKNHRIRVDKRELSPDFVKQDNEEVINEDAQSGGFLWRFSNAWRTMFDSFKHQENELTKANSGQPKEEFFLDKVLLDVGVVTSWLEKYKKTKQNTSLENFLKQELKDFLAQPTFSQEDRKLVEKILKHFAIDLDVVVDENIVRKQVLTPQDIGWLLPNTARPKQEKKPEGPKNYEIMSEDGEAIEYYNVGNNNVFGYRPGDIMRHKETGKKYVILGLSVGDNETIVFRDEDGNGLVIEYIDLVGSKSIYEKVTPPEPEGFSLQEAKEILGAEKVFDHQDVKKTWGVDLREVPEIPFSREDLEKAKEMGMFLILRIDKDEQGNALSPKKMEELKQADFTAQGKGKIFYDKDWYKDEEFFTQEVPEAKWALTSGNILANSTNKNYIDQTALLRNKLEAQGWLTAEEEQGCTDQELANIEQIMASDWKKAAKMLSELKITQNHHLSFAENMYDFISILDVKNSRILESNYSWGKSRSSNGRLVSVGGCGAGGARVDGWEPDVRRGNLGVSFSR
ncbi:MAG: AAA family ATPase [Candidatus Magasanikbacteria bacterium]